MTALKGISFQSRRAAPSFMIDEAWSQGYHRDLLVKIICPAAYLALYGNTIAPVEFHPAI